MTASTLPESISSSESSRQSSAADSPDLLSDCQIMLRFALKEGLSLPDAVRHDVAELDQILVKMDLTPISAMPAALLASQAPSETPSMFPSELLLKVHGALSSLVAPATALTLQGSEPPSDKHHFLGGLPVLVKLASWVALGCAVGFVGTSIPAATQKVKKAAEPVASTPGPTRAPTAATTRGAAVTSSPTPTPNPEITASVTATSIPTPTPNPTTHATPTNADPDLLAEQVAMRPWLEILKEIIKALLPSLNAAFGAGLGAAFYILLSTQPYLTNRSFDPKYNAIYACRFITGLIGGIILSIALGPVIASRIEGGPFPITPGILAILGGYAAEAVQQILQRLVEVMLTAVRGDGSAQAQAKSVAALAEKNAEVRSKLGDIANEKDDTKRKQIIDELHATLKRTDPS